MQALRTAGALGLGASLMYLLDPQRGRARRARLRDKAIRTVHEVEGAARGRTMDAAHRVSGALAQARRVLRPERADDDVIRERVRARMGRLVDHPHELETNVQDGMVILSGRVSSGDLSALLARMRGVRGVRGIENRLDVYGGPPRPPATRQLKRRIWTIFFAGLALALVRSTRRY